MDLIQVVLFGTIILGILLILFSMYSFSIEKIQSSKLVECDGTEKLFENALGEMDKIIEEFHQTTKSVFEEMEGKYQELLFLYSLMDEKKNEIAKLYEIQQDLKPIVEKEVEIKTETKKEEVLQTIENPYLKDILSLEKNGLSVSQIAKKLNMGQGEVRLILELGKAR